MHESRSSAVRISGFVWLIAACCGATFVYPYTHRLALTGLFLLNFWMTFVALQFLIVLMHELGHALGTWAVGYRLKVISVGPLTIRRDGRGIRRWNFNPQAIWIGGFIGAIPNTSSRSDLRVNAMLIVFAGPFVTLICAVALFLTLINLPGTGMETWWAPVALAVVLFNASFFQSMTPVGILDGNRLLQMALRNRAGEEFLKLFVAATHAERAEESRENFEFDDVIASRTQVVEQILAAGGTDRRPLADAYLNLGRAQFHAMKVEDTEASLNTALGLYEQCRDVHPALVGDTWTLLFHVHHHFQRVDPLQTAYGRALSAYERAEKKGGVNSLQLRQNVAELHLQARHPELARNEIERGLARLAKSTKQAMNRAILFRMLAACDFALGCPERGRAAAREVAALLRSPAVLRSEGRSAAMELSELARVLWQGGQDEEGIVITREAVAWLETKNATELAARMRIPLVDKLRKAGCLAEAESTLPSEADLPPNKWDVLCTVRGRIRLAQHRFEDAVNDFERVIHLREANRPSQIDVACNKNDLAEALFGYARVPDAERQALESLEILLPSGHPNASGVLITLALIGWHRCEPGAGELFEQGIRCLVDPPLVEPALKARGLEYDGRRLRYYDRANEAARAENEARAQWRLLGVGASVAEVIK